MVEHTIIKGKPTIWPRIQEVFPDVDGKKVCITYGNEIFYELEMVPDLLHHELVHVTRQMDMGKDIWWERYFADPRFRYDEELLAYREQYLFMSKRTTDRNWLHNYRVALAKLLSSPMYGSVKNFSQAFGDLR